MADTTPLYDLLKISSYSGFPTTRVFQTVLVSFERFFSPVFWRHRYREGACFELYRQQLGARLTALRQHWILYHHLLEDTFHTKTTFGIRSTDGSHLQHLYEVGVYVNKSARRNMQQIDLYYSIESL